jgi:hypothetical protein
VPLLILARNIFDHSGPAVASLNTGASVMKTGRLLVGVLLLAGSLGARSPLDLHVSPAVSSAPATLRIRATVAPDADNRAVAIIADSESFFRSSEVQLEGDKAPRNIQIEYRDLPAGRYEIRGVLVGSRGKRLAVAYSTVTVTGIGKN